MTTAKKVALIIGSTRGKRVGPQVVDVIQDILKSSSVAPAPELSILDIKSFNLPVFDEDVMPAMVPAQAQFAHEHSKAWSAAIASFDAYILVSPEYNYGVPSGVKNAIDYLYNELTAKPMLIITYGIHGGFIASESLKKILEGMKMRVVETRPQLRFAGPGLDELWPAVAGTLGEKTKGEWEAAEANGNLVKGFGELVGLLGSEGPVAEQVHVA